MTVDFPYTDLVGMLPLDRIVEALDDNKDGEADDAAWASVLESVGKRLTDIFGGNANAASNVALTFATLVFAAELLFGRRGFSGESENPWTKRADAHEKRLRAHATGSERPMDDPGGGVEITQPAQTYVSTGEMLV
jgi:hypothetical protein